jgi:pyridoxine 5-phosphate synthase
VLFRSLPYLDEVSIGHAIISRAVFFGLSAVIREYLQVLGAPLI